MADDEKDRKPTTTTGKTGARIAETPAGAPRKKAAGPAKRAARVVDDDESDEDDDFEDEDDEEEEEEEEELPRRRASARSRAGGRPAVRAVAARRVEAPPRTRVIRQPSSYYVPFAIGGMMLVGAHVFFDIAYAPVAVLGISLCVWAYMGIGSANEISR